MNWFDVAPKHIARAQQEWERTMMVRRMRECRLTYDKIAARMNVTRERIRQIERRRAFKTPPIVQWSALSTVVLLLARDGKL